MGFSVFRGIWEDLDNFIFYKDTAVTHWQQDCGWENTHSEPG